MAPKVSKRPASVVLRSVEKKPRGPKPNPVAGQCKEIASALEIVHGLSDSVRKMLAAAAAPTLGQFKDLRHPQQTAVAGWIQEAFAGHQSSLEAAVNKTKVDGESATVAKATSETAVAAAEEALTKLQEVVTDAESKSSDASVAVKAATSSLKTAKEAQTTHDSEANAAADKKQGLEAIVAEDSSYHKMKVAGAKKKDAEAFVKLLKKDKFEAILLQTLAPVLLKESAARTEFDNVVLKNLEEAISNQIAGFAKIIEDAAPTKDRHATAVASAETALESAKAAADAAAAAVKQAETAVKASETAVKDAKKAHKASGPAAKEAATAIKEAESALDEFIKGPLATFQELLERTAPVEVMEPAADEPAADAPAADAGSPAFKRQHTGVAVQTS